MRFRWYISGTVLGVAGLLVAAYFLSGRLLHSGEGRPGLNASTQRAVPGAVTVQSTITIDPAAAETFAPATPRQLSDDSLLTPDEAWARWATVNEATDQTVPSGIKANLGDLTLPQVHTGPRAFWTYQAKDELVYGFSGPSAACVFTAPNPPANPGECVPWTFLDAKTGILVDRTQQPLTGPASTAS